MRIVRNGLAYDTERAEMILPYTSNHYGSDYRWEKADLYRTKRGVYFVHGEGNAASRFRRDTFDGQVGGYGIVVITEDDARKLVEEHASWRYEEIFGPAELA